VPSFCEARLIKSPNTLGVSLDAYKNFTKNKHKIVVGKLEEKSIFRTLRSRWKANIKVDLK